MTTMMEMMTSIIIIIIIITTIAVLIDSDALHCIVVVGSFSIHPNRHTYNWNVYVLIRQPLNNINHADRSHAK